MTTINQIPVRVEAAERAQRTNPLAHVFDEFVNFCRARSLFILH